MKEGALVKKQKPMKTTLLFGCTFLFMSISAFAQETLRVEITNLKSSIGKVFMMRMKTGS